MAPHEWVAARGSWLVDLSADAASRTNDPVTSHPAFVASIEVSAHRKRRFKVLRRKDSLVGWAPPPPKRRHVCEALSAATLGVSVLCLLLDFIVTGTNEG